MIDERKKLVGIVIVVVIAACLFSVYTITNFIKITKNSQIVKIVKLISQRA